MDEGSSGNDSLFPFTQEIIKKLDEYNEKALEKSVYYGC